MNKQVKTKAGVITGRGIEWTDYTHNVIGGCQHGCRWQMPDGKMAVCYAEDVAKGVAQAAYPQGFEHHYWHPAKLGEPAKLKNPSRIFVDSMADMFGHWVPDDQLAQLLASFDAAPWHTFQSLTKNAPRLLTVTFPLNLHVGVSTPPDHMFNHPLARVSQEKMLARSLEILSEVRRRQPGLVTWMSIEPLSWDVAPLLARYPDALQWAVIGAASDGKRYHQPDPGHVQRVLDVLDARQVPVFFKGNLAWTPHREEFPAR